MSFTKEGAKKYWIKRVIFIPVVFAAGIFIFGSIVMYLWNAILPQVLGVNMITFWQALGILLLSKILFGGFFGRRCHGSFRRRDRHAMWEKWNSLSPEEKENMRKKWKSKFESPDNPEKET